MVGFVLLVINSFSVNAQSISRAQNLSFGTFITYGQGGTVSILPDYSYNTTGDIILKSIPSPASFDIYVEAGKTVQLIYNNNVILNGPNGGKITLILNDSSPSGNGSIITGASPTRIILGGKLIIGSPSVSPVGSYIGTFQVGFTVIH